MTLSVKHAFQTGKGDGPDTTRVKPTNWNAEHVLVTDGDGVLLGRPAGSGPGPILDLPIGSMFYPGIILPYGGATPPDAGWLMCFGQLLSRTVEANLFAVIGTNFGAGDGATTFAAPDGRGVAMVGKTNMGGGDKGNLPGGSVLGALLGGANGATGTINSGATNYLDFGNKTFTTTFAAIVDTGNTIGNGTGATVGIAVPNGPVQVQGYTRVEGNQGINVAGASGPFSIVQPSMVVNYIIKR